MGEEMDWDRVFKAISIASAHRKFDTVERDEGDLFQVTTPSEKASWANGVIYSNFDGEVHRTRIAKIVWQYRDLNVSFKWLVGPGQETAHLQTVLEELGLKHKYDCVGMMRNTEPLTGKVNEEIEVKDILSEQASDFVAATIDGWALPAEYQGPMSENVQRQIEQGKEEYFVASVGGRPVGSGIMTMMGDCGYLKRGSVIPEYRGQGVFKALVAKRLGVLRERGISTALVLAKEDTAAPRCEGFGFQTVSRIHYFFEKDK